MTELIQFFSGVPGGALRAPARQTYRGAQPSSRGANLGGTGDPLEELVAQLRARYLAQVLDEDVAPRVRLEAAAAVRPWVLAAVGISLAALFVALSATRAAGGH